MRRARKPKGFVESSGNVFTDLRLPNPEEEYTKSALLWEICQVIRSRGLKQIQAAEIMGIPQPQVSTLLRGRTSGFSVQRLSHLLGRLGRSVTIVVSDEAPPAGPLRIPVVRDSDGLVARLTRESRATPPLQPARPARTRQPARAGSSRVRRSPVSKKK